MTVQSRKIILTTVLYFFLLYPLCAQYYGDEYSVRTEFDELYFTVRARNCNLSFMLENAKGYSSYFATENDGIWFLSPEGWVPSDSNQASFVKNLENSCYPYQIYDCYEDPVQKSPVGTFVSVSKPTKKDPSVVYYDSSYIPFSSHLSQEGKLVNAAWGTFYVSCLLENDQCITFNMMPDFYLFNNEYYLLDPDLDTLNNQAMILNTVFGLQSGNIPEDTVAPEMVQFATPQVLPQFIAESIWNNQKYSREGYPLYESFDVLDSGNGYITLYLDVFLLNELPIMYSDVYMWFGYDYTNPKLHLIDEEKGSAIASAALELQSSATDFTALLDAALKSQGLTLQTLVIQPEQVHLFDLESFGVIVPEYEDIKAGNVLVNTRNEENPFALVIDVKDDAENRSDVSVIYYNEDLKTILTGTWDSLSHPEHYCCRHLLDTSVIK